MQIINLTIKGCSFVGNGANYNDGIKIDSTASFGVKGNVSIINNHLKIILNIQFGLDLIVKEPMKSK